MAPVKATRKRKSEAITGSINGQKIHTIRCSPERSPIKKRKLGLSLAQKQALIDNLQLEITERARRLRAQYNIQAQQLRSRVEMRVNRIPTALRKLKMGELLSKSLQPHQPPRPPKSTYVARPPPVPAKDGASAKPLPRKPVPAANAKGLSEEILGLDKENQGDDVQNLKKRPRGIPGKEPAAIQPGQVLSPTSSNTRIVPRARPAASPIKTLVSRPASPMKGPPPKPSSNIISSMADRVKASRPAITSTRKPTTSSMTSSANGNASVRARQAAVPSRPPTAASTRGRRKASTTSESSNGSSTSVVKKTTASRVAKTTAPAGKKTVMSTIKSATTKKPPATKAAASGTGTGRTLRKRA
ncbi:Borealin N terminal-domain-containing protein [Daldinia vernicosa]|uniref:Borealin N terminal-domain-containing protein n=1 Tax=Daldinia vernicosa TaxID=114800 RepID=UPI002007773B|nr:Borealin N terminal-domain-containing protein [Daldinia vernicosa]KAI0845591.1 Borealin N terminal-domain-containing protein [Daldinia vernicosa]